MVRTIRLSSRSEGLSLAGIRVRLRGGNYDVAGLSDADGRVVLRTPRAPGRVGCEGDRVWCRAEGVRLDQVEIPVSIWAQTHITGSLNFPQGSRPAPRVAIQALNPGAAGREVLERMVEVQDGGLQFDLPPGVTDLRLAAEGFGPAYLWQVDIEGRMQSIGAIRLVRGASVSGTVVDPQSGEPARDIEVRLQPVEGLERGDRSSRSTRATTRGFFQIQNVPVGQYQLIFMRDKRPVSLFAPLAVSEDSEVRLDRLPLTPPVQFGLMLSPPTSPDGDPWKVILASETHVAAGLASQSERVTRSDGRVEFNALLPGAYTLMVSAGAKRLLMERITIETDRWETRELPTLEIHGRVRLGGRPIAATVKLSTGSMDSISIDSDAEGVFSGWIRRPAGNVFVEVHASNPELTKNIVLPRAEVEDQDAEILIDMEDVRLRGRVSLRGKPRAGVVVRAQATENDFLSATSDENGEFEIYPLSRVRYVVTAYDRNFPRSKPLEVDGSRPMDRLNIELAAGRTLQIQVVTPDGSPVAGARVKVDPVGYASSFLYQATSTSGALRIPVPAPASRLFFRVISASAGVWSGCVASPENDSPITVVLPGPVFGYGRLDSGGSPPLRVLVSRDGGAWPSDDLFMWPRALRAPDGASMALPPGEYAGLPLIEPWERFVERWCAVGAPTNLRWTHVSRDGISVVGSGAGK